MGARMAQPKPLEALPVHLWLGRRRAVAQSHLLPAEARRHEPAIPYLPKQNWSDPALPLAGAGPEPRLAVYEAALKTPALEAWVWLQCHWGLR